MCVACMAPTGEVALRLLRRPAEYDGWNTTTVLHVAVMAAGKFDAEEPEVRTLALQRLAGFAAFVGTQPYGYVPKTGLERMYAPGDVAALYAWAQTYAPPAGTSQDERIDAALAHMPPLLRSEDVGKRTRARVMAASVAASAIGAGVAIACGAPRDVAVRVAATFASYSITFAAAGGWA